MAQQRQSGARSLGQRGSGAPSSKRVPAHQDGKAPSRTSESSQSRQRRAVARLAESIFAERGFRGTTDHESDLVDRLQSDLEYLEGWTILRDIKIILLTMRVMVHDRAY